MGNIAKTRLAKDSLRGLSLAESVSFENEIRTELSRLKIENAVKNNVGRGELGLLKKSVARLLTVRNESSAKKKG